MARVALDRIPQLARPPEVEKAIGEALALRDRAREASEAVAAAQANVDELEREDIGAAAARARAGEPLGTPGAALKTAREQLVLEQRAQAAVRLAAEQAEQEVAEKIISSAEPWRAELDAEAERAREHARAAISTLRDDCARIGDALATKSWIGPGVNSGVFDHQPIGVTTGSFAPSSRRRTANSEPLLADELFGYLAELVDPPAAKPTMLLGAQQVESESDAA
jgi:hypothetical protein